MVIALLCIAVLVCMVMPCYMVTMLVCRLVYVCIIYGGGMVCLAVWLCYVYMSICLCLCVVSLYVCALCHVLVVYVLVLEWLGWSVQCCCWWLCPCLWFALVSMPNCLCAYLIVSMLYY